MIVDISTAASLIGALGVGSVAGQYAGAGAERRQTRAAVFNALHAIETSRWFNGDSEHRAFYSALQELETASLLARLPRSAVIHYKHLATAAFWATEQSWEELPNDEELAFRSGGLESTFDNVVREAAQDLSRLVWSPLLSRITLSRRISGREKVLEARNDGVEKRAYIRARETSYT